MGVGESDFSIASMLLHISVPSGGARVGNTVCDCTWLISWLVEIVESPSGSDGRPSSF